MSGYVLLVRDQNDGRLFFVGRRDSLTSLLDSIAIYQRDPIAPGHFFGVHIDEKRRVTWSDDWSTVVDAGLAGLIERKFHPGYGDPYAQFEEYIIPAELAA